MHPATSIQHRRHSPSPHLPIAPFIAGLFLALSSSAGDLDWPPVASVKYRDEAAILGQHKDTETVYVRDILPDKIELAKTYVAKRSLWLDLKLIFQTVLGGSAPSGT